MSNISGKDWRKKRIEYRALVLAWKDLEKVDQKIYLTEAEKDLNKEDKKLFGEMLECEKPLEPVEEIVSSSYRTRYECESCKASFGREDNLAFHYPHCPGRK